VPSPSSSSGAGELLIANEFARVRVCQDFGANGVRLAIKSLRTGREIYLDALQLESLTWLADDAYQALLAEPFGPY
jgi:hypothetical protein